MQRSMYLFHILKKVCHSSECLFAARDNLLRWQYESVLAGISQLRSEGVICLDNVCNIVNAAATGLVNCRADWTIVKLDLMNRVDCVNGALGKSL
jgi:hypothetical protein